MQSVVVQWVIRRKKSESEDVGLSGNGLARWWIAEEDLVELMFCGPTGSPRCAPGLLDHSWTPEAPNALRCIVGLEKDG